MGRKERPLDPATRAAQLATGLRELRRCSGLTYRELGRRAHFHYTVMWRVAAGKTVGGWDVVEAFVVHCTPKDEQPDLGRWKVLWAAAREPRGGAAP